MKERTLKIIYSIICFVILSITILFYVFQFINLIDKNFNEYHLVTLILSAILILEIFRQILSMINVRNITFCEIYLLVLSKIAKNKSRFIIKTNITILYLLFIYSLIKYFIVVFFLISTVQLKIVSLLPALLLFVDFLLMFESKNENIIRQIESFDI